VSSALSSRWCSPAWSGSAKTSTAPKTRCRKPWSRRYACGPSSHPATRPAGSLTEPSAGVAEEGDDTLFLLFCCYHPDLSPASQVALSLRAVGGQRLDQPGDLAVVLRVLYLVYTAGHTDRVDLAAEAIRLARQLTPATDEPEARGLLALMLLNHARLPAKFDAQGPNVLGDRHRWHAARGYLLELDGDHAAASVAYARAGARATNIAERDRLVGRAAAARIAGRPAPERIGPTAAHDVVVGGSASAADLGRTIPDS
jgi:predicted RNA polymerase sigma factor